MGSLEDSGWKNYIQFAVGPCLASECRIVWRPVESYNGHHIWWRGNVVIYFSGQPLPTPLPPSCEYFPPVKSTILFAPPLPFWNASLRRRSMEKIPKAIYWMCPQKEGHSFCKGWITCSFFGLLVFATTGAQGWYRPKRMGAPIFQPAEIIFPIRKSQRFFPTRALDSPRRPQTIKRRN